MTDIAVLGLGAMGSRMALKLLQAGHRLVVWNRTPNAAAALVAAGARQAHTPKDAAANAEFVIAMLSDDDASHTVWLDAENGALSGLRSDALAIESSTLSPHWVRELGQIAAGKGRTLIEAPVSGSRPQAEAAQLVYLVGGDQEACRRAEPILKLMGSAIHHLGPLGNGALTKLATNALLGIQVTALAELIGMLKHSGADAARVFNAVSATAVWSPAATRIASSMLSGDFSVQFPVELMAKDFRYALSAAGAPDAAPVMAAAQKVFLDAISKGYGEDNMTSVARLYDR